MPINWGLMDTQYPQKLSDLFNPNTIQQRQVAASDQNTMNQLRQAQLMQAAQGLQRAPELARREDVDYKAKQDALLRQKLVMGVLQNPKATDEQKKQALVELYPEKAAEQAFKPVAPVKLSPGEMLLGPDNKPVYTAPQKPPEMLGKIEPKDYTPDSFKTWFTGGMKDPSLLRPITKAADNKAVDWEMKLADDYRTESKGFAETSTSMKKVLKAIETADTNAASALAAGTAFMKILDPGSVVRESELGMALNASGWFDRAGNVVEKLNSGVIMTKAQKENLKVAANNLFEEAKAAQREVDAGYTQRAKDYGLNPSRIIMDRGQNINLTPKAPSQDIHSQADAILRGR